jgi:hypothetical protein
MKIGVIMKIGWHVINADGIPDKYKLRAFISIQITCQL